MRAAHDLLHPPHPIRGAVTSLSIHPSGRLALSVSADSSLRLWDLTKGRPAFTTKLPSPAACVRWSEDGALYALLFSGSVTVHDGGTGAQRVELRAPAGVRLLDCVVYSVGAATLIAAGCEGGDLRVWDARGSWCAVLATGHARRVRCVSYVDAVVAGAGAGAGDSGPSHDVHPLSKLAALATAPSVLSCDGPFLATVDSECVVKLWPVAALMPPGGGVQGRAQGAEVLLQGVAPAVTLTAGSGARATALATTRLRVREASEMAGHAAPPPGEAAGAGRQAKVGAPAAAPKPGKATGAKRARAEEEGAEGGAKRSGSAPAAAAASGAAASAAATAPIKRKALPADSEEAASARAASAAASAFSGGGFKVKTKAKHAQVLRPPSPPAPEGEREGAGDDRGGAAAAQAVSAPPLRKKKGVRFSLE